MSCKAFLFSFRWRPDALHLVLNVYGPLGGRDGLPGIVHRESFIVHRWPSGRPRTGSPSEDPLRRWGRTHDFLLYVLRPIGGNAVGAMPQARPSLAGRRPIRSEANASAFGILRLETSD